MAVPSIGVGITTHNRRDVLNRALSEWNRFLPHNAVLVVVDDASDTPVPDDAAPTVFRFDENVGIAQAKNAALALMAFQGVEHYFLVDDDTWPLADDWWVPYVESPEPHLLYHFLDWADGQGRLRDSEVVYRDESIVAYSHGRGCFLYVHKDALLDVGGFDPAYGKAMHEHIDWSTRIHNRGWTTFRFADVPGSNRLIYSSDEHEEVSSSVSLPDRKASLEANLAYFEAHKFSSRFVPFDAILQEPDPEPVYNDVILTTFFTSGLDAQRGYVWKPDPSAIESLCSSVNQKARLVVLNDCFDLDDYGTVEFQRVPSYGNPYFMRWLAICLWLRANPSVDRVFAVDSTDVELLRSPFPHMKKGVLYTGDEPSTLSNPWMYQVSTTHEVSSFMRGHQSLPLLNCGVVGGSRADLMKISRFLYSAHHSWARSDQLEMPLYNYFLYSEFNDRLVHGNPVNTRFKANEVNHPTAWFRHK